MCAGKTWFTWNVIYLLANEPQLCLIGGVQENMHGLTQKRANHFLPRNIFVTLLLLLPLPLQSEAALASATDTQNNGRGGQNKGSYVTANFKSQTAGKAEMGDASGMFNDLGRDHVLTMIAVSLTYFKMSSRRVVDGVPMLIMHHLLGR
jgi:hypothetical protein